MGKLKKREWTEKKIQDILTYHFLSASNKKYNIYNLFVYDWESDYIAVTKSDYTYECEIKVSRADFFNDLKKAKKHVILESADGGGKLRPNYFYYAVPDGLVTPEEVPEYAGLLYVQPWVVEEVKPARKLLEGKSDLDALKLVDKFYWCSMNYRQKFDEADIRYNKSVVERLGRDLKVYDDELFDRDCQIDDLKKELEEKDRIIEELRSKQKTITD